MLTATLGLSARLTPCGLFFDGSQQLEYLEDKLRELRFVAQDRASDVDDQKSVLLGQLDAVRKELVEAAYAAADKVVYGKDLLKEIISFALADDEENKLVTPGQARGRFSVEHTPRGKRTPAVPDSLEGSHGRNSFRVTPGSSAGRLDRTGRPPRPDSTNSKQSRPPRWTEDDQRKYSSLSRTFTVTDEDIYGPKTTAETFGVSPDPQKYGGTVKVKELLEKAERGLTDVASAQKGRRSAPRVIHDDISGAELNGDAWMNQELLEDEFVSSNTQFATPGTDAKLRKGFSATSSTHTRAVPNGRNVNRTHVHGNGDNSVRRIDYRQSESSAGGLLMAISKLAGLAVIAGSIAAGAVLLSKSATRSNDEPKVSRPKKKGGKKSKARKKRVSPEYRGEADIYVSEAYNSTSDDTVFFEEHTTDGPQSPVANVHQPPATTHFPAASPDVSVAMG